MRNTAACILVCLVSVFVSCPLAAQAAVSRPGDPEAASLDPGEGQEIAPYDARGRRDPFVPDLAGKPVGPKPPPGLPGQPIDLVQIKGISLFAGAPVAILLGTDGRGYTAREGSRLYDGAVLRIDFDKSLVVFKQRGWDDHGRPVTRDVERRLEP